MDAQVSLEMNQEQSFAPLPLPVPEELQHYGLARSLVAAAPMIQRAREYVRHGAYKLARSFPTIHFDPIAIEESLAANLAEPLLSMITRVMVLELNVARLEGVLKGNSPEERFISFLNRLRESAIADQIFSEYPALKNEIDLRLEKWSGFSLEFLQHFCEDWQHLHCQIFKNDVGEIVKIQGGAGDTHRGGRSVMIVSFASGDRVVYKPRSLSADQHFQQLLAWVNKHGAEPQFRLLKVLDRGDHGWSEFIAATPCNTQAELSRFYRRQGGYLALLYAIEGCDFHYENLIAAGEDPMLVDLEALFHPRVATPALGRADELAWAALGHSVLGVGLLPTRMWATDAQPGIDIGGLANLAGQLTPFAIPHWEKVDTDEMQMIRKRAKMSGSANCPTLAGQPASPFDYSEDIARGFESTYRLLLMHSSELFTVLRTFEVDEVRVIPRATSTYATLFYESFHPDLLRDSRSRESFFNKLHGASSQRPELEKLVAAEQSDLLRGDIPLFTTRAGSRDLWSSSGLRIANYFSESGMSLVERRLSEFSEKDLERQLWIVRASIATMATHTERPNLHAPHPSSSTKAPPTYEQLISAAAKIGDRLAHLALGTGDEATWIGLETAGNSDWCLSPLGPDLYDGLPGIIFFLAYLGALSGNPRYDTLAKAALKALSYHTEQLQARGAIGAFAGLGGIIYLLTHLGVTWSDPSLFREAENLVNSIPALVERDQVLDVIGGAAGCALVLLALHKCKPSALTLEAARACGERLVRTAQPAEHGIAWPCGSEATSRLTGFAHGNAGIAYALVAVAEATREPRFQRAALDAFEYERSLYSPERRNWPDLRNHAAGGFTSAWCHGAPGIGLSRLCSLRLWSDSFLHGEIEAALTTTWAEGLGDNHALCHGDLGNGDILLHASEILHDVRWRAYADQIAAAALANSNETGWVCAGPLGVESPGLMTGLAGIGYALLRLAAPARVASVLALDAPVLS